MKSLLILIILSYCFVPGYGQEKVGWVRKILNLSGAPVGHEERIARIHRPSSIEKFLTAYAATSLYIDDAVEATQYCKEAEVIIRPRNDDRSFIAAKVLKDSKFKITSQKKFWLWVGNFMIASKGGVEIITKHGSVKDISTVFYVSVTEDSLFVFVLEGAVEMRNNIGTIIINSGRYATSQLNKRLRSKKASARLKRAINSSFNNWRSDFAPDFARVNKIETLLNIAGLSNLNTNASTADAREPGTGQAQEALSETVRINVVISPPN